MTALLAALAAAGLGAGQEIQLLDPVAVPLSGDPLSAVVKVAKPVRPARLECDVVIAGGGMGGVAAALSAARLGARVCMTEVAPWLGGQMSSQGVSAFDENEWIEGPGATRSYQDLRRRIRAAYGKDNPGQCWVSRLCFEPRVGVRVLDDLLAPYSSAIRILRRSVPVSVRREGGRLRSLLAYSFESKSFAEVSGKVFIDATETGDLLPLAGVRFTTGAESRAETGEADAPTKAAPQDLQSFTYPFVLARGGGDPGIPFTKPPKYELLRAQYTFRLDYGAGRVLLYGMYDQLKDTPGSFWDYRRLVAPDLAMINWPGNDACDPGYLSPDPATAARALQYGKQLAAGFAWWLKHEAGGSGFPELILRGDVLGTADGLSMYPYIRESRRMAALETVREQDVAEPWQTGVRAKNYADTAGIGYYPIDIHGCAKPVKLPHSKPYQVPFGALLSREVSNLLAGCKNLGVTHVTNGAYRLHPTEWAIGEAVGTLAAAAVRDRVQPVQIYRQSARLRRVQRQLLEAGHPLVWFDDVKPEDPDFVDIQWSAVTGARPLAAGSLHARGQ